MFGSFGSSAGGIVSGIVNPLLLSISTLNVPADASGAVAQLSSPLAGASFDEFTDVAGLTISAAGVVTLTTVLPASATRVVNARVTGTLLGVGVVASQSFTLQAAVAPAPGVPVFSAAPVVTGTATQGQTLTGTTGTASGSPTYTRLWALDGVPISGATAATYLLTAAEVAPAVLTYVVRATNVTGFAEQTVTIDPVFAIAGVNINVFSLAA